MENKNENNCRTYDVLMVTRRPDALTTPARITRNSYELFFSFFCNFLFVNVENPQISPQKIVLKRRLAHG